MNEARGSLYLLTGLILGLALGLLYGRVLQPVQDAARPDDLRTEAKDRYRVLIAYAYRANGSLPRARARLELLHDPDPYGALADQASRALETGQPPDEAQALGMLAVALGQGEIPTGEPALAVTPSGAANPFPPTATSEISATQDTAQGSVLIPLDETQAGPPGPTSTSLAIPTLAGEAAVPTFPSASSDTPFVLNRRDQLCETPLQEPLLQVQALDPTGIPKPGVEVMLTWEGGEEVFFTGLKPEFGQGYADFTMQTGITYTLRLGEGGEPVSGLVAPICGAASTWGAWLLTFQQP